MLPPSRDIRTNTRLLVLVTAIGSTARMPRFVRAVAEEANQLPVITQVPITKGTQMGDFS